MTMPIVADVVVAAAGPARRQLPQRLHLPPALGASPSCWPGSRCGSCDRPLAWYDNMPLVSYAVLRGRCRTCGSHISLRYPIVEAITMVVFLLHWHVWGLQPLLAAAAALRVRADRAVRDRPRAPDPARTSSRCPASSSACSSACSCRPACGRRWPASASAAASSG